MAEQDESRGPTGEPTPLPPERPPPPWKGWKLVEVSAVALAALAISGGVIAGLSGGLTGGDEEGAAEEAGGDSGDGGDGGALEPATHPLRVATDGEGSGVVTSIPSGIECGVDCDEEFPRRIVRLRASPSEGSVFAGFSGCSRGHRVPSPASPTECIVNMNTARSVTATFEPE